MPEHRMLCNNLKSVPSTYGSANVRWSRYDQPAELRSISITSGKEVRRTIGKTKVSQVKVNRFVYIFACKRNENRENVMSVSDAEKK